MYTPEPIIRLKKNNHVVLSAEDAERLLALKEGNISKIEGLDSFTNADGSSLNQEGKEILKEYMEKSLYFKDLFSWIRV